MPTLDQFESIFKKAERTPFVRRAWAIERVVVVTDRDSAASADFIATERARWPFSQAEWSAIDAESAPGVGALIQAVERAEPDLIVTWRNLHNADARAFPFSLGTAVDVLTQAIATPVLVLPDPGAPRSALREVVAITDHMSRSEALVSRALALTPSDGKLVLAHVEDDGVFRRYAEVIGKIPEIDTDLAVDLIRAQLLKDADDYIGGVCDALDALSEATPEVLREIVMGHRVEAVRALIDRHDADLLVLETKDDGQLAMHGLAYPVAVGVRSIPQLLL